MAGVFAVGKPSTLESAIDRLVAFFSSLRVVRGFYGLCKQKPGLLPVPKPECPFHTAKRPWHEWSWLLNSMHLEKQGPSKKVKPSEHYGGRWRFSLALLTKTMSLRIHGEQTQAHPKLRRWQAHAMFLARRQVASDLTLRLLPVSYKDRLLTDKNLRK